MHLDHLISRQSIRYIPSEEKADSSSIRPNTYDPQLRYSDINAEWFKHIRKPDFQRETNAWSPKQCLEFLDSVVNGHIIPSLILWRSTENGLIYVLDGAHRLSVIRAWMLDDWGDKAGIYYDRRDKKKIIQIASETRNLVNSIIGSFEDYAQSRSELDKIVKEGKAPKKEMTEKKFNQSTFYSDVVAGNLTLFVQWEQGDYESAEQSFLRINRQGQPLDPWEATLIEYRKSSYSRCIMSIANGGQKGHYWPDDTLNDKLKKMVKEFPELSRQILQGLFVPPFQLPIKDLNVPTVVAPAYFQKHVYLLELIPLMVDREIAGDKEDQLVWFERDFNEEADVVIKNADKILRMLVERIEHLVTFTHNSKSLSLVPLFYWYNHRGQYIRGLLYGFLYWLFSGSDKEINQRKLAFSAIRDRFEFVIFNFKSEIAEYHGKAGAGLKAVKSMAKFYQNLVDSLVSTIQMEVESSSFEDMILNLLQGNRKKRSNPKKNRSITSRDKTQVNIRELFESSTRCHICGGIVNLQYGGIQYDHVEDYAKSKITDPEGLKPTHPYCNNKKIEIFNLRKNQTAITTPILKIEDSETSFPSSKQLMLFWGEEEFPE